MYSTLNVVPAGRRSGAYLKECVIISRPYFSNQMDRMLWASSMASEVSRFVWGHTKSLIYETPVESQMDLVGRMVDAARLIEDNSRVFDRVQESLLRRYQTCIDVQGRHFEKLL